MPGLSGTARSRRLIVSLWYTATSVAILGTLTLLAYELHTWTGASTASGRIARPARRLLGARRADKHPCRRQPGRERRLICRPCNTGHRRRHRRVDRDRHGFHGAGSDQAVR